ncbi:L-threonylcarbamoyladenylate synthase [Endozoicomonas gorgoniicola]|uniref:Threonylcarbamoyl-AMP synthase n=1 Tax=Endozoicomonas gorgoniicola TaxID=1234144 RepID=A0ABT3N135_9GAMM|nr:L-threonylcarbamoyladenylate synthase [Endozoicomonas gorgoniicola]MCW7555348.1 L-threonylcarbamoyladenylate synthase [Endozoicomonas gorgoniicola]
MTATPDVTPEATLKQSLEKTPDKRASTARAAMVVHQGGVIAYPTEAVWGLGCDPWNRDAVYRILDIKARPVEKGMILVAASESQIAPLLEPLTATERQTLSNRWPGPFTWLIPDINHWVPDWVKGQFDTVAVRISDHPVVQALCEATGHPLISTSANRAGEPPLLTEQALNQYFGTEIDLIVPGETGSQNTPSEIRDLRTGQIIRSG